MDPLSGRGRLLQVLGVAFGLAVLLGNTILVGILRTPGDVASRLPSAGLFIGVWVFGGVYALLGTISLAEPGAMIARSGGQYGIVHRALGPYSGFIVGWSDWLSTAASVALGGMVIGEYAEPLLPVLAGRRVVIACGVTLFFGVLQWRGVRMGDVAQQLLSALKALAFGALITACLVLPLPDQVTPVAAALPAGAAFFSALVLALQSVIYTYDGWTGPLYFGEETVDPGRSIPRAMIGGVLLVSLIYVLLNVALVRVLGVARMAGDPFVAATAGHVLFGDRGDLIIRLLVLGSILGGVNATVLMACRIPLAMSHDGLLPAAFDRVNAGGTPTVSHWVSIGLALGFILSGSFEEVLALAAFFFVANYAMSFISVFALRRNEPDTPRPYRVPGYPYTTGLVLLGALAFLVGSYVSDQTHTIRSLLLLAISYPIYRLILWSRRHDQKETS
ncbi:MAG: APC family permease [Gemmatimonadales bacterium]